MARDTGANVLLGAGVRHPVDEDRGPLGVAGLGEVPGDEAADVDVREDVGGLRSRSQGSIALMLGFGVLTEVESGQGEPDEAHRARVLAEPLEVHRCVRGPVRGQRALEVAARRLELAEPEGGDPDHVVAFGDQDGVVVVEAASEQAVPAGACSVEVAPDDRRVRGQPQRRRLGPATPSGAQPTGPFVDRVVGLRGAGTGMQRDLQGDEELELDLVALRSGRPAGNQLQRPPAPRDHVLMGEHGRRVDDGASIGGDRCVHLAGALEMSGDLRRASRFASRLQGGGSSAVQVAPPGGADREVGDLADLVVAEVVTVEAVLAHDASAPQFIDRGDCVVLLGDQPADAAQRERTPDDRRRRRHLPSRFRELIEAALDHRLDAWRDRRAVAGGVVA